MCWETGEVTKGAHLTRSCFAFPAVWFGSPCSFLPRGSRCCRRTQAASEAKCWALFNGITSSFWRFALNNDKKDWCGWMFTVTSAARILKGTIKAKLDLPWLFFSPSRFYLWLQLLSLTHVALSYFWIKSWFLISILSYSWRFISEAFAHFMVPGRAAHWLCWVMDGFLPAVQFAAGFTRGAIS